MDHVEFIEGPNLTRCIIRANIAWLSEETLEIKYNYSMNKSNSINSFETDKLTSYFNYF